MQRFSALSLLKRGLSGQRGWSPQWRRAQPKAGYDAVIVGGGGHGLGAAYYLAKEHGLNQIAVLEKGNLVEAMFLGEVIGRSEAMSAAADDHGVITGFRLRSSPLWAPTSLAGEPSFEERQGREALHTREYLMGGRARASCRVG